MPIPSSPSSSFFFKNGSMYCEEIEVDELCNSLPEHHELLFHGETISIQVPATPAYIYSSAALKRNVEKYITAMRSCELNGVLGFAAKSNGNLHILEYLKSCGVEMLITVSGNEILAGLRVGFSPNKIIFNGNGKQSWEIKLAIETGVILNVDSIFDARRIVNIIKEVPTPKQVQVLLRIRPSLNECDVLVHPYVNTSDDSKFGFGVGELDAVLAILNESETLKIVGVHCHLGSCITETNVYSFLGNFLKEVSGQLEQKGVSSLEFLNIGGGIGVDYSSTPPGLEEFLAESPSPPSSSSEQDATLPLKSSNPVPRVLEFIEKLSEVIPKKYKVIVEPGRSLVAQAGIIVSTVLGTKELPTKKFMVIDAAMTELIRPCLYDSHHQIFPTKLQENKEWTEYDVVGPVCESADFLGKKILLQNDAKYVAIMDCGAYASSMSSNYNLRPKPAEILVDGKDWKCIRSRETFEDIFSNHPNLKSEMMN